MSAGGTCAGTRQQVFQQLTLTVLIKGLFKQQVSVSSTLTWIAAACPTRAGPLPACSGRSTTSRGSSSWRRLWSKTLAGRSLTRRASPPPSFPSSTPTASARPSSPKPSAATSTLSALSLSARCLLVKPLHQDLRLLGSTQTSLDSVPRYQNPLWKSCAPILQVPRSACAVAYDSGDCDGG